MYTICVCRIPNNQPSAAATKQKVIEEHLGELQRLCSNSAALRALFYREIDRMLTEPKIDAVYMVHSSNVTLIFMNVLFTNIILCYVF